MKIVFTSMPMKKDLQAMKYPAPGNADLEFDEEVIFPVNAVLARELKEGEKVSVVMLMNKSGNSEANANKLEAELNKINSAIKADISYYRVEEEYEETKDIHESRFRQLIEYLVEGAEIITDITYGQKTLPVILFCVLNFAEKFFDCDIKYIVYGKGEFDTSNIIEGSQKIYDLTPLYYLNALTSAMEAPDGKAAIKIIDRFFAL